MFPLLFLPKEWILHPLTLSKSCIAYDSETGTIRLVVTACTCTCPFCSCSLLHVSPGTQ